MHLLAPHLLRKAAIAVYDRLSRVGARGDTAEEGSDA
jgi:hypothetical protein